MTAQPPVQPSATPTPPRRANTVGLIALIVAIVAFVLAVIPATAFIAWLPAVAAIVLAIVGLTRKGLGKGTSIAAIIVAPIAWLIAIIVAIVVAVGAATGAGGGSTQPGPAPAAPGETAPEQPGADGEAALGETITNSDGVSVTFTSVSCGIATAGPQYFERTAKGQFCEVRYTVDNGSDESLKLLANDITGLIGTAEYDAEGTISEFGGEKFSTDLNPGLSVDAIVFIDIPADATLEYVAYQPAWSLFSDELRVRVS